jgi:hypothetical protein
MERAKDRMIDITPSEKTGNTIKVQ